MKERKTSQHEIEERIDKYAPHVTFGIVPWSLVMQNSDPWDRLASPKLIVMSVSYNNILCVAYESQEITRSFAFSVLLHMFCSPLLNKYTPAMSHKN